MIFAGEVRYRYAKPAENSWPLGERTPCRSQAIAVNEKPARARCASMMNTSTLIEVSAADGAASGALEVTIAGSLASGATAICAAHPADDFGPETAALIHGITDRPVVCINVRGVGRSTGVAVAPARAIAAMTDDLEVVRRRLRLGPWAFWGMSGGGWIGQQYAERHPAALTALVLESACACFRLRLADPACVLSPFHPAWRPALEQQGLIAMGSHDHAGDATNTEWMAVPGIGSAFRRRGGPALLVSPMAVADAMKAAMPALWCFDARPWLGRLRCPTLVIAGAADPVVPLPHVQAVLQAIPGAQLSVIDGGGHVPSAQGNADARAAIAQFLRASIS
jgi:3-oxoadipate enol-lactonase